MKKIVCVLLSVLLVCAFTGCHKTDAQPSDLTVAESATLVKADGQSYYISENRILHTGKTDALVTAKNGAQLGCLQADGDCLYYAVFLNADSTAFEVHRVPVNGGADTVVLDHTVFSGEHALHNFTVDGNHLYLGMDFAFFSYDLTTDTPLLLAEDAAVYEMHDAALYFIDHAARTFTVYKTPLSGGDTEIVLGGGVSEPTDTPLYKNLLFIGDTLYIFKRHPDGVTGKDGIYAYTDGVQTCVVEDASVNEFSLAAQNGMLYFVSGHRDGAAPALCVYDPADGTLTDLCAVSDFGRYVCMKNGWYYYTDAQNTLRQVSIDRP